MVASFGERSLTLTCEGRGERARRGARGAGRQPPGAFLSAPRAALPSFERARIARLKEERKGESRVTLSQEL